MYYLTYFHIRDIPTCYLRMAELEVEKKFGAVYVDICSVIEYHAFVAVGGYGPNVIGLHVSSVKPIIPL